MSRPLTGSIPVRYLKDGAAARDVKIRTVRRLLGPLDEWPEKRAMALLENKLLPAARLGQDWTQLIPAPTGAPVPAPDPSALTVLAACSEYVAALETKYHGPHHARTLETYRRPVELHLLPGLAFVDEARTKHRALVDVTPAVVRGFIDRKRQEAVVLARLRQTIEELRETRPKVLDNPEAMRAELDARATARDEPRASDVEWTLLMRYGTRGGHWRMRDDRARGRISLGTSGLSNVELNRCLARLRAVIRMANNEYRLSIADPTEGATLPKGKGKSARTWLLPQQFAAVLRAAAVLDARPPEHGGPDYRVLGREAMMLLMGLGAPRVSEVADARWRDLNLGTGYLTIPPGTGKTDAAPRPIKLFSVVVEGLRVRMEELDPNPDDRIWPTEKGGDRDRNSIRTRVLAPVVKLARTYERLPDSVTPHTMRRTALTYYSWAGFPQRWAMDQAGHASSRLTLECYQQRIPDDSEGEAMVRAWLDRPEG